MVSGVSRVSAFLCRSPRVRTVHMGIGKFIYLFIFLNYYYFFLIIKSNYNRVPYGNMQKLLWQNKIKIEENESVNKKIHSTVQYCTIFMYVHTDRYLGNS